MAAPRSSGFPFVKNPAVAKKPAAPATAAAVVAETKVAAAAAPAEPVHSEDTVMAPEAAPAASAAEPSKVSKPKGPKAKRVTTAGAGCLDAEKLSAHLKTLTDADRKKYGLKAVADFAVFTEATGMSMLANFNRVCEIATECGVKPPKADVLDFSKVPKQNEHIASAYMYFCSLNPIASDGETKLGVTELSKLHGAKWAALRSKAQSGDAAAIAEIDRYQKLADEGKEAAKARANDTPMFSEASLKHSGLPFAIAEPEPVAKKSKKRKAASSDDSDDEDDEPKKKKGGAKVDLQSIAVLAQLLSGDKKAAPKKKKAAPKKTKGDEEEEKPKKKSEEPKKKKKKPESDSESEAEEEEPKKKPKPKKKSSKAEDDE
jgi:hypothetical protein